jgi:hypothetical protein
LRRSPSPLRFGCFLLYWSSTTSPSHSLATPLYLFPSDTTPATPNGDGACHHGHGHVAYLTLSL